MKKILLLGGSTQQIPAIEYAKSRGYKTVLCDYLKDNPGQHYADSFYCVSTTDKEAVLEVAIKEKIDGILAYASDPAAPTAAFVGEALGIPTNPFRSVEILAKKGLFRSFLATHGYNYPKFVHAGSIIEMMQGISEIGFPAIIKPTDCSGSKGVQVVSALKEVDAAFNKAMALSREKRVIIEEFIHQDHPYMVGGDCFVLDGQIVFFGFLNSHRDTEVNPYTPVGTSFPVDLSASRVERAKIALQKLVSDLGIVFGGFNIEIMFNDKDDLYIIELGPRNGGNMIPDLLKDITGFDMVGASVETALGNNHIILPQEDFSISNNQCYATHVLHSKVNGRLEYISYSDELKKMIYREVLYKERGDNVEIFNASNNAIGIIFLKDVFSSNLLWINNSICINII